ncbi:MAG: hypothetical protein KC646_09665 [Candidatus Cloacimonetes bacterium]|nr:hypothetical protein [Candidatus Cloacimonadota bacterium]
MKLIPFVASTLLFLIFTFHADIANYWGGGDTAYFMRSIHSLVNDGDLWLSKEELKYENYMKISPITLGDRLINSDTHRYSFHPNGLVFFMTPFYALGGKTATVFASSLLNCIGCFLIFLALRRLGIDYLISVILALLSLWNPIIMGASTILTPDALAYPIGAFVLYSWAYDLFKSPRFMTRVFLPLIILAGFNHLRFIPALGIFFLYHLWKKDHLKKSVYVEISIISGVMLFVWYLFNWHITGNPLPNNFMTSAGNNHSSSFALGTLFKAGLLGIWLDQQSGIFIYYPISFVFPLGLYFLSKSKKDEAYILIVFITFNTVFLGSYFNWHSQWGPPGRFTSIMIPFLTYLCAICIQELTLKLKTWIFLSPALVVSTYYIYCTWTYPTLLMPMNPINKTNITNQNSYLVYLYNKMSINLMDYIPEFICIFEWDDLFQALCFLLLIGSLCHCILRFHQEEKAVLSIIFCILSLAGISVCSEFDKQSRPDPIASDPRWKSTPMKSMFNYERMYLNPAVRAYQKQEFHKALDLCHIIYQVAPKNYDNLLLYFLIYMQMGDSINAIQYLNQIEASNIPKIKHKQFQSILNQILRSSNGTYYKEVITNKLKELQ